MINLFIRLFGSIDVTSFNISAITYYESRQVVEEYFCFLPEYKKFNDYSICFGEGFAYKFTDINSIAYYYTLKIKKY